jgi:hypothetical protein
MRITGRYSPAFRRLIVQLENTLRIYRFGVYLSSSDDIRLLPSSFTVDNFPNPFNPTTEIAFDLAQRAHVTLSVFDINGRQVATLADEIMSAGSHARVFDGSAFASGVYLYRLEAGNEVKSGKMVLLK